MSLKVYTQAEFDALPVEGARKICPSGDYRNITSFGEVCSFGEGCSFESGRINPLDPTNPFVAVDRVGSEHRKAYFFMDRDKGLHICAGCFFGDKDAFLTKLHTDDDAHKTAVYEMALALAELQLGDQSADTPA